MSTIDRSLPIATYYQISRDLQSRIGSGEWSGKKKLPPETYLAKHYEVSRMTVRQALAELEKDGIVSRVQGVGTFIRDGATSPTRLTMSFSATMHLLKALRDMGYDADSELSSSAVIGVPSEEIARLLRVSVDADVAYFERKFTVDGKALVLSRSFLPHDICVGISKRPLINSSIHETLASRYGIQIQRAERWVEAVRATDDEVLALDVEAGSPLLLLTTLVFDESSSPVEYVSTVWRGDTMRIHLEQETKFVP